MERGDTIQEPISSPEIRAFASGFGDGPILSPSHVAWLLESAAIAGGWQANSDLGSEADLLERFAANRDVVRSAVRIVEARGSMKMRRGCRGGLQLLVPNVGAAAVALAIYLRSHGCPMARIASSANLVRSLLPGSGIGDVIRSVIEQAMEILSDSSPMPTGSRNRAEFFAMRIIARTETPMPAEGVRIGSETQLCSEFGLSHRTFRQALNILEDLEILSVRLGRGGGYFLKPASAMGVIRRIFVLLASRQVTIPEANQTLWQLGIARLRTVFDPECKLDEARLEQWAEAVMAGVMALEEPRRWVRLQHSLDDLIDEPLTKVLTSAMVAYVARTELPPANHQTIEPALHAAELGIIAAIKGGNAKEAERHLQAGHALLDSLALSS